MKLSKEAKIGVIVFAGIVLLFWGLNYLKGRDFFTSQKLVYAMYSQVDGLAPSNTVQINGMKIGLVHNLVLLPDHSGRIIVSMHINNKARIPRNSIAQIFSTDLLGSKGIRFVFGDSKEEVQDGDTLNSDIQPTLSQEVNAQVAPLKEKAENLVTSLDSVLSIIRTVFNEKTKENLKRSFESISKSLVSIEHIANAADMALSSQGRLKTIFENLESISNNFKENNQKITTMINNFSAISDTIAKANISGTLENTRKTLEHTAKLFEKINKGEGTLGQLANNDSLYTNLNNSSHDLDVLLKDLHDNPKKYFSVKFISIGGGGGKDNKAKSTK